MTERVMTTNNGLDARQLAALGAKLRSEREGLVSRLETRRARLTTLATQPPDEADWAAESADQSLLVRLVDRDAKLLAELDHALRKLDDGSYGLCETTGEPIGWERLAARPWSRHSLVAKERREREESGEEPAAERFEKAG